MLLSQICLDRQSDVICFCVLFVFFLFLCVLSHIYRIRIFISKRHKLKTISKLKKENG